MNSKQGLLKLQAPVLALSMAILLVACNLNRSPIIWINDVQPQFVCPGDNVTLSWNVDVGGCLGDGCPPPVIVGISSNPAEVLGSPLSVRGQGERAAGPITGHTSFTFSATGGDDRRDPDTHNVDVVLPDRETIVPLNFAASCSGSAAVWRDADLSIPEFRADGVRLVRVCNTSRDQISLTLTFGSGSQRWILFPGRCTEDLPPELGSDVLGAHVASLDPVGPPGARCDTSSSLPPDLNLTAALACDLMSASEPIVAATPDEAEFGIIPLMTDTPTPTPTPGETLLVLDKNANCRRGPGTVYSTLTSVLQGQSVQLIGRNNQNTWWLGIIPGDFKCWISSGSGQPDGDPNQLPVLPDPPTPTVTLEPEQGGTDFDKDGYDSDKDCNDKNDKIHPGAPETPDDKVDSNCNGNDDN